MTALVSGDRVACTVGPTSLTGTYITDRAGMRVVKLDSGYNIGVDPARVSFLERVPAAPSPEVEAAQDPALPELAIVSTGGTIASRIDYRTGAVTSQFTAADILRAIPGLGEIARFRTQVLATILSENMTPALWQELARAVHGAIRDGAAGVIVTHGTDTMAHSAAALAFMLSTPVPVVFVGSQRSADRPSSDNVMNGICAASAAVSELGEVAVVMHEGPSDDRCAIHRATRVRKLHTSRRDAFESVGSPPLGTVAFPERTVDLGPDAVRRGARPLALDDRLEPHCGLVQFYPGMEPRPPRRVRRVRGARGGRHRPGARLDPLHRAARGAGPGRDHGRDDLAVPVRPGLRPGLRHGPRPPRLRRHRGGDHAPRGRAGEADVRARPDPRPRRGRRD